MFLNTEMRVYKFGRRAQKKSPSSNLKKIFLGIGYAKTSSLRRKDFLNKKVKTKKI